MRITGAGSVCDELAPRARSRACPCGARRPSAGGSRSPRRRPRRRAGGRASKPLLSPGRRPERSLTVTGTRPRAAPSRRALDGGARERDGAVGVGEQRGAGAGLAHLRHRAAHVDVDRVGAARGDVRGGGAHRVGVFAEQLDRRPARPRARAGRSAASRCTCARCGGGSRARRPSPRRPCRRRSAWPAGARTSCRSRRAARAARGWARSASRASRGR